ncbi:unnamed protein product [Cyclocybe aegerita]|uniref:Uncharacterized protein n=1 Tax=Cyclocybe aegerita TaxID=1973307 RepID=A0A8S0WQX4_CYCAE|nr:unnamed protein product [Cyclocybe aegerita]
MFDADAVTIEEKMAPYASQIESGDSSTNYLRSCLALTSSELDEANEREVAVSRCLDVVAKNWQDETAERQLYQGCHEVSPRAGAGETTHCGAARRSHSQIIAAQMRDFGEREAAADNCNRIQRELDASQSRTKTQSDKIAELHRELASLWAWASDLRCEHTSSPATDQGDESIGMSPLFQLAIKMPNAGYPSKADIKIWMGYLLE